MPIFEIRKDDFLISTDNARLDIKLVHDYLYKESYWAKNIPVETVVKSIAGSFCFAVYHHNNQIGFARVITDYATFGYIADVFIIETFRGRGLSKWLLQTILTHPRLQGFRRWMLATRDAHGLYAQFGFTPLEKPERYMFLKSLDQYPEK